MTAVRMSCMIINRPHPLFIPFLIPFRSWFHSCPDCMAIKMLAECECNERIHQVCSYVIVWRTAPVLGIPVYRLKELGGCPPAEGRYHALAHALCRHRGCRPSVLCIECSPHQLEPISLVALPLVVLLSVMAISQNKRWSWL